MEALNQSLLDDQLATHGFLNYASASLQGQFAEVNVLGQFAASTFNEEAIAVILRHTDRIEKWLATTLQGECLFSAKSLEVESFDSQAALTMLKKLRDETAASIERLRELTAKTSLPTQDELKQLLGLAAHSAYARDAYVRGFVEFGKRMNLLGMIQNYGPVLGETAYQVETVNALITDLQKTFASGTEPETQLSAELAEALYATGRNTLVMLRCQLHDLRQLVARYEEGFNYTVAGFSGSEASAWDNVNINAIAAGYWRAYEFRPEQADLWTAAGMIDAQTAATWRGLGFSSEEAKAWAAKAINPFLASRFKADNVSVDDAVTILTKQNAPADKQLAA